METYPVVYFHSMQGHHSAFHDADGWGHSPAGLPSSRDAQLSLVHPQFPLVSISCRVSGLFPPTLLASTRSVLARASIRFEPELSSVWGRVGGLFLWRDAAGARSTTVGRREAREGGGGREALATAEVALPMPMSVQCWNWEGINFVLLQLNVRS